MVNLVGKWKIKEIQKFSLEDFNMVWKPVADLTEESEDEKTLNLYRNSELVFYEDGTAKSWLPLPEGISQEEIAEIEEEGKAIVDGKVLLETTEWKVEDGKNMYNTRIEGEIADEEVSPWVEIVEVDDMIEAFMMRYARAE